VVQAESDPGKYSAENNDTHILHGVGHAHRAGPEEAQQRAEEDQRRNGQQQGERGDQNQGVAEHLLGLVFPLFAEADGDQGIAAQADQHTEGHLQLHDRKAQRRTGDAERTYPLPDENPVDDVIEGTDHHADDGGN